jgi:hypothetical protein
VEVFDSLTAGYLEVIDPLCHLVSYPKGWPGHDRFAGRRRLLEEAI